MKTYWETTGREDKMKEGWGKKRVKRRAKKSKQQT